MLLRPVKKQLLTALRELPLRPRARSSIAAEGPAGGAIAATVSASSLPEVLDLAGLESDPSLKKLALLKNHLVEKVKTEPAGASRLIQNWLREGGVE